MLTTKNALILALVVAATAWAGDSLEETEGPAGPTASDTTVPQTPANPRSVNLHLRGVWVQERLDLRVSRVDAFADGVALRVTPNKESLDLSRKYDHLIGTLILPEGARTISFRVHFAPDGVARAGTTSRTVSLTGSPVTFSSPAEFLLQRNKAVLLLDVDRSLASSPTGMVLLPSFTVGY